MNMGSQKKVNTLKGTAGGIRDDKVGIPYRVGRTAHFDSKLDRGIHHACAHGWDTDESYGATLIEHNRTRYAMVRWDTMAHEQKKDRPIHISERKEKLS